MDYQALSKLVSKPVQSWRLVEIKNWLHFISMQKYYPMFENNDFNGQLLRKTTIKNLSQMGISSNINQKKLMIWIEKGLQQFNSYLQNTNADKQNICPNLYQRKTSTSKGNKKALNSNVVQMIAEQPSNNRLRITNYQGSQTVNYIADSKGLKIGRLPTNQVQSLQVTVQNNHAKILMQNDEFYLMDLGTKSGSFIKVHYKIQLLPNMLIQLGSYLFTVQETSNSLKKIKFQCMNISTGKKQELIIDLNQKPVYSLGRRNNNDFARDDQHMSGTHAKIYFFQNKFILEDMGSTNGTWLRLSESGKISTPYKIQDGSIFKIGNTITYICTSQTKSRNDNRMQIQQNSHICLSCNSNPRNILFLPCKHTINCENCCIQHQQCPLCKNQIEEKIKIYI